MSPFAHGCLREAFLRLAVCGGLLGPLPLRAAESSPPFFATLKPYPAQGAMFRWWIPAGFANSDEVDSELATIAAHGFRGVEISINMADTDYSPQQMKTGGWDTPAYAKLYQHILRTGNRLGLKVDTTISPAWPAAVPTIMPEDPAASKELQSGVTGDFTGSYDGEVPAGKPPAVQGGPAPPPGGPAETKPATPAPNRPVLVAVIAARVTGTDKVTKTQLASWGDMPATPRTVTEAATLLDPKSLTIVQGVSRDAATGQYRVHFVAPSQGRWRLFSFWMKGTAQQNKQGQATSRPSYVVDHYGRAGAQAMIDFWNHQFLDPKTKSLLRRNGGSIFEDSLELQYDGLPWSPGMLAQFKARRGYDLTSYLPLMINATMSGIANVEVYAYEFDDGTGHYSPLGDRVRRDYAALMTTLYTENHVEMLQDWAASLGLGYRAQSFGEAFDLSWVSTKSVGPDVESLGFGPGPSGDDRFRLITGGAHMAGREQLTDEVGALANLGYRLTWRGMLAWIDKNFADGATRMMFHGFPYAISDSSVWPGYTPFGFGLGGDWGPRNPDWVRISDLGDYLSRVQSVLLAGQPKVDVALLKLQYGTASPVFTDQGMWRAGYSYEVVSPALLSMPAARVTDGALAADGPAYRAGVLDNEEYITAAAAGRLVALIKAGWKLVVVGSLPAEAPYFDDWRNQDGKVKAAMAQLAGSANVRMVADESQVPAALRDLGVTPASAFASPSEVAHAHRRIGEIDYYFLYNYGGTDVDQSTDFAGAGNAYRIDPWNGRLTLLAAGAENQKSVRAPLQLRAGEATLIAIGPERAVRGMAGPGMIRAPFVASASLPVNGPWQLTMQSWQNAHDPRNSIATRKTIIPVGVTNLESWQKIPSLGPAVSGIGTYRTSFSLGDNINLAAPVMLDLGTVDAASVGLWVNGTRVPVNQFTNQADVTGLLRPGSNQLVVEVTSTLGNRLIANKTITAPAWDPTAKVSPADYGLIGPVNIEFGRESE